MKTAAAYIRVSDERQDEFSPDSQLKLIRDYCQKNDIDLPEELIFYDDGISAKSTKNRKQFNEMIALAKQKEKPFEMILVWKFSRFARNQEESIVYKSLLRKNGVEVLSVSEQLGDNPFGGLVERIIEWMDEYYIVRLGDEVRRGMTERATRGLPNVPPPYGYSMKDGAYVVEEAEAAIVRIIFELYTNGMGARSIAHYLQELGVKTRSGHFFETRTIEYVLSNPCYIGYLRWNPHRRSSSARQFNNSEDIVTKATHEPIISEEIFKRAEEITENKKKRNVKYAHTDFRVSVFALKGLVRCSSCGATLVYQKTTGRLQCHRYNKGMCKFSHSISLDALDQLVLDALKHAVVTMSFRIANLDAPHSTSSGMNFDTLIHREELKLERAKQAYQSGIDSLQEYKTTKEKIQKKIGEYQNQKTNMMLAAPAYDLKKFAKSVTTVIELFESNEVSQEIKNEALRSILQKIVYSRSDNQVELYFYI